jgi:hypothetical protein
MTSTRSAIAAALALGGGILLGGCGSGTKTVSAAGEPAAPTTTTATATATATTPTTSTPSTPSGASGGTTAPSGTTRTAPEPAFTETASTGAGAGAAAALLRAHGYTADDTSQYHPSQTLRVLVGTRTGSGDGYGQQAFFFVDGRYIGTDASEPSAAVNVVSQGDTEVTLAYPLYRPKDPLCCPGGGHTTVHFQLNNGHLVALQPIPPTSSSSGLSRY